MTRQLLVACVLPLLAFATVRAGGAKKDQESLQGAWEVTAFQLDGKTEKKEGQKITFVFAGDSLTVSGTDGDRKREFKYSLDPTKTPRHIDLMPKNGDVVGKVAPGIYQFDNGLLKLCVPNRGETRPNSFDAPDGSGLAFFLMKRVKS